MAVVRNLLVRAGADFSSMRKSMQQAQRDLNNFKTGITKSMNAIGAVLAATGITLGIRTATKEAMAFEAALQQINRMMGDSAASFRNWADEQASAFGMARSEAVRYGAVYANLLSGFSNGTAETMQRTKDLLQASAVIASSTGRTMDDTMERIRSGLLGNTEAIEDLGVQVGVSLIESTQAFRKFAGDRSWEQLDFNTQQTVRYFAILEQAASKYGLEIAQNTSSRQAAFVAELKNAQLALGQAFLPIYNAVLPALTSMAQALASTMNVIAQFSQALFGSGANTQTAAVENQVAAVENLGEAYSEAGKAARGSVAGFDEVNQLAEGAAGGSGAPGSIVSPTLGTEASALGGIAKASEEVSLKIKKMAENIKQAFRELSERDDVKKLAEAYRSFRDSLRELGQSISDFFKNPSVQAFGQWYKENLSETVVKLGTEALYQLNDALVIVRGNLQIFSDLLKGDLKGAAESAWTAIKNIDWVRIINFARGLANPIGFLAETVGKKFLKWLDDLQYKIPVFGDFKKKVDEVWNGLRNTNWSEVKDKIVESWDTLKTETGEKWDAFKTFLGSKWTAVKEFTNWDAIKDLVLQKWDVMKTKTGEKWDAFKSFVKGKWDAIAGIDFSKVGSAIMRAWESIKKETGEVWDGIAAAIKNTINTVIDAINRFLRKVESIKINIPEVRNPFTGETLAGGGSIGMPKLPTIPRLANGGITNGPMLAMVGDNPGGREVVSPLDDLMDMIQSAVATGVAMASQMGSGQSSTTVVLDGVKVSRGMNQYNERERNRLGGSMITVT